MLDILGNEKTPRVLYKWDGDKDKLINDEMCKRQYEDGLILFGHNDSLVIINSWYNPYEISYERVSVGDFLYINGRGEMCCFESERVTLIEDEKEYKIEKVDGSYHVRKG